MVINIECILNSNYDDCDCSSVKYAIILYSPMWLGEELSKDILD